MPVVICHPRSLLAAVTLTLAACSSSTESSEPAGPQPPAQCVLPAVPDRPLSSTTDTTFVKGPYMMHTTTSTAIVMWESKAECDGYVELGTDPSNLTASASHAGTSRIHEVPIGGLTASTRYFYRVHACAETSTVLDFMTAPEAATPVRFTVVGDSQSHPEISAQVVAGMMKQNPYFVLHAGDTVAAGVLDGLWTLELFEPFRPLLHHVPLYVAIGNHENNAHQFYDFLSYPASAPDDPQSESYYSFTWGNVFVLVIDTNKVFFDLPAAGGGATEMPISAWVKAQVASDAAKNAVWRIAIGHAPAWSESWSPGDCSFDGNEHVRDWLMPLLAEHRFQAYFAGHTHAYERGMVGGVLHVITGGGGGDLDEWCRDLPVTQVVRARHHFMSVEAGCDKLVVQAIDAQDGNPVMDRVELAADRWGEIAAEQTSP